MRVGFEDSGEGGFRRKELPIIARRERLRGRLEKTKLRETLGHVRKNLQPSDENQPPSESGFSFTSLFSFGTTGTQTKETAISDMEKQLKHQLSEIENGKLAILKKHGFNF